MGDQMTESATKLFGLKTCDTCRKAARALSAAGQDIDVVDVRADPLNTATLARFLDAFGDALVNRRSTTWRSLTEVERSAAPADLLAAHPALMKRPVIEGPGGLTLGWDNEVQAQQLSGKK